MVYFVLMVLFSAYALLSVLLAELVLLAAGIDSASTVAAKEVLAEGGRASKDRSRAANRPWQARER